MFPPKRDIDQRGRSRHDCRQMDRQMDRQDGQMDRQDGQGDSYILVPSKLCLGDIIWNVNSIKRHSYEYMN